MNDKHPQHSERRAQHLAQMDATREQRRFSWVAGSAKQSGEKKQVPHPHAPIL